MNFLKEHEILLGTYEEFVVGLKPVKDSLTVSFTDHGHSGSIKALAASGKYLVSGAADEQVKIYNLRNRREHGNLHHHEGTITALVFYDDKHLMSGAEDGKICILNTKGWNVEKTLLKHTQGVIDIAIHPSGKLALSVGKDRKMVTWNLIKGRSAYVTNIKEVPDFVRFSKPSGKYYAVGFFRRVDVYETETASVVYSIEVNGRSNDVVFINEDVLALAGEMPEVEIHSLSEKKLLHKFEAHEKRVRCLHFERSPSSDSDFALVTCSNDGFVKVWSVKSNGGSNFNVEMISSHDTKCRITKMVVHKVPEVKSSPPKPEEISDALAEVLDETKKSKGKRKKTVQVVQDETSSESKDASAKRPKLVVEVDDSDGGKIAKNRKKRQGKKQRNLNAT